MSNIIDFIAKKTQKEKENSLRKQRVVNSSFAHLEKTIDFNKVNQERIRKERELSNKNVMKNYKIKSSQ